MTAGQPDESALVMATSCFATTAWTAVRVDVSGGELSLVLGAVAEHVGDAARQTMHGGVIAGFLEDAARIWLRALGNVDARPVDFTTEFVRAAAIGDLHAGVVVVRSGRRVVNVRVDAYHSDRSEVVAVGHGLFISG